MNIKIILLIGISLLTILLIKFAKTILPQQTTPTTTPQKTTPTTIPQQTTPTTIPQQTTPTTIPQQTTPIRTTPNITLSVCEICLNNNIDKTTGDDKGFYNCIDNNDNYLCTSTQCINYCNKLFSPTNPTYRTQNFTCKLSCGTFL